MTLNREQKQQMVEELHKKFSTSTVAILMEFKGLDVLEMTELRQKLRGAKGELRVVKNTLARRAAEGTTMAPNGALFEGPIAVTFGYADPVAPAKVVREFIEKRADRIKVKAGVIEGQIVDAKGIRSVAALPRKEVLVADVIGRLQSPIRGLVGGLQGILRSLVYVMAAVRDKQNNP